MKIQKKILSNILQNLDKEYYDKVANKILYTDLCILYNHLINSKNTIFISFDIKNYYKMLLVTLTAFHNFNLFIGVSKNSINDHIEMNNNKIDSILKNRKYSHIPNKHIKLGKIYFEYNNTLFFTNWYKIRQFVHMSKRILKRCFSDNSIYLESFDSIYYIYFIGYMMLLDYKLSITSDDKCINITDKENGSNALFICHKYTLNIPKKCKKILFYSFNIGQYLLYNVLIDSNKIVGKLFSIYYIKQIKEKSIIIFNGNIVNLPNSYNVLKDNIIMINKNTSKIKKNKFLIRPKNISLSQIDKFFFNNKFIKRSFFKLNYKLTKIQGYKIYYTLLEKFPELCSKSYNFNCQNIYLYNQYKNLENTIFSLILINKDNQSTIIIDLSYSLCILENKIIYEIDNIIHNLLHLKDIKIKNIVVKKNCLVKSNNIYLLSEIKSGIYILTIYFLILINLFKIKVDYSKINSKKQLLYEFDNNDYNKINNLSNKYKLNLVNVIRSSLIKAIFKFFPKKILLYITNDNILLIPNITKNKTIPEIDCLFNIFNRAKISQSFSKSFIFKIMNSSKYLDRYNDLFIQVNEQIFSKKFNYMKLTKINNNNFGTICSTQISYSLIENDILLNLSFINDNDKIKYVVPEMLNL